MLEPKHFVLTTPQVIKGKPVLVVVFAPDDLGSFGEMAGDGPGEFSGWTFLHDARAIKKAGMCFFEQLGELDEALIRLIELREAGIYTRELEGSAFEKEEK